MLELWFAEELNLEAKFESKMQEIDIGGKHYHDNTIIVSAYYHKFPFSESMANSTIMLVSFH